MNNGVLRDIYRLRVLFVPKDKLRFAALFLLMLLASLLEAIGIGIVPVFVAFAIRPNSLQGAPWFRTWVEQLPSAPTPGLLIGASLLLVVFMALKALIQAATYYVQCRLTNSLRVRVSCRMFETYQAAPYEWLLQRSSAELQRNILTDVSQVITGVVMPLLDLVMAISMGLFIILAMILTTRTVTLVGASLTGVGLLVVVRLFRASLERAGSVARRESQTIIEAIQHGFGAFIDARLSQREAYLARRFRESLALHAKMLTRRVVITRITPLAIELVALCGLLVVFLIIALQSEAIVNVVPTMSLLAVATIRLKQIATRVAAQLNMLNTSRPSIPTLLEDVHALNTLRVERKHRHANSDDPIGRFESLTLDHVSYRYPDTDAPAVKDISLQITRGESIGFAGETGCGKSTLIHLMLGLLEPQSGSILVNNTDLFAHLDMWHRQLAFVPQTIFLLDDSIRSNIAFGIAPEDINISRLAGALEMAQLSTFVEELTKGVDTLVGERGVRVSGGQRQRIGIARALYLNPDVLVLDEATSALDSETELAVMDSIKSLREDITLIMIAHRLTSLEGCHRIYQLERGHIATSNTGE